MKTPSARAVRLPVVRLAACLVLGLAARTVLANPKAALLVDNSRVDQATLLAIDDHSIPFTENLQLTMETPEKYRGNPVVTIGKSNDPDEWQLQYYGSVVRYKGKFMMWYDAVSKEGFSNGKEDWRGWRFAYAESPDGMHWTKPDLGLVEFRGSRHNNLIQVPDGFRGYHLLVMCEPEEPDPSRRFKMLALLRATGRLKVPGVSYGKNVFLPMYSPDGVRWRVADELVKGHPDEVSPDFHLVTNVEGSGVYKWKGFYYVAGQSIIRPRENAAMAPYGRYVQIWRSSDFLHWSKTQTMGFARQGEFTRPTEVAPGPALELGTTDGANEQTHEGASVWNRGNVLIGITGFWHGTTDWTKITHDLGLLVSNDGLHYREPKPDFNFARIGEYGRDWDYRGLSQGQGFENVGDRTFIWYGAPVDQTEGYRTGTPFLRHGGVGLLLLGRDRFGYLESRDPDAEAVLITSAIEANQPVKLSLNAEGLGPDSRLRVDLLDEKERALAAYSGSVTHSGLRVPVSWSEGESIGTLNQPFKIRVSYEGTERNAIRLYALYLSP